jgi:5-methylcytosine-specific restriction protein A
MGYCNDCVNERNRQQPRQDKKEYDTEQWKKLRAIVLAKNPLCLVCQSFGETTIATEVDHIREWRTGRDKAEQWRLFVDMNNMQSLCKSCHSKKTFKHWLNNRRK